ncbi:hypothetical protein BO94DRAFT_391470 [Aspergillus sclerotioniger CBS 115572]|uniref:Uncharacterized protein n=1 Tax=Aspergillus sclerotioniger CBS 115572 TaxID=1450535 RepID=A0A317X4C9_9EURO|nr:hypothetical protein BO94DRAFT_391470 [Aspergillus sclerotioniger CBS 115572]PWY91410.1 hypothetical protein BO94DRAFT_391470 [Aspergillus sclerotioniger CBS 115572]
MFHILAHIKSNTVQKPHAVKMQTGQQYPQDIENKEKEGRTTTRNKQTSQVPANRISST